jgi:hypothetical protein
MKDKNELLVQTNIRKSVIREGGYGFKMSNRFLVGVVDLFIALPPYAPCVVEVKDLGTVVDKFSIKLEITPKQAEFMEHVSKPYEDAMTRYTPSRRAACVLVALKHRGQHRLVVLPRDAQRLDHTYEASTDAWTERAVGGHYDVKKLFNTVGMLLIKPM